MKKLALVLAILVLAASFAACTPSEEPVRTPDPTATPEPTPEPTPEVYDDYIDVYAKFVAESIVVSPYFSPYGDPAWALVLGDTLTGVSEDTVSDLYWCTHFALADLDFDGAPELFINFGEVEHDMYVFTVKDGKVAFLFSCLSGNQGFEDAITLYKNGAGETLWVSESLTGTGAGNLYECGFITDSAYALQRSYTAEPDGKTKYYLLGEEASEDTFNAATADFASKWAKETEYNFSLLGTDAQATVRAALVAELQTRFPDWQPEA